MDKKKNIKNYLISRNLPTRVVSDYISRLNRIPKILMPGKDTSWFYKIDEIKELEKLKGKLEKQPEFKNSPSKYDIRTAFKRYIESIENLKQIKPLSNLYLRELNLSYHDKMNRAKDKKKAQKTLSNDLKLLLNPISEKKSPRKYLVRYLKLRDENSLKLIRTVSKNLDAGRYVEMVYNHYEVTAIVIALNAHVKSITMKNK